MRVQSLEQRVDKLEQRNTRVELDKAWEVSITRKLLIFLFTYLSIGLYMLFIGIQNPWLNAIVPAVGFVLSTLTLPFFKQLWAKYVHKP